MSEDEIYKIIEKILGGSLILIGILCLILITFIVFYIIGFAKLFKKAGKPGWTAIVPFYNTYSLVEIAGLNWWYFLIAIAGTIISMLGITGLSKLSIIASGVANFFIFYNLGKKFRKNPVAYGILGIFFSGILIMILGYSSIVYDSGIEVSPNGPIGDNNQNTTNNNSAPERFCLGCGKKLKPGTKFCENCGKKVEE